MFRFLNINSIFSINPNLIQVKIRIGTVYYFLDDNMKFTEDPHMFQIIPTTPDEVNKMKANLFALQSGELIKIHKANVKEGKQAEEEKEESKENEDTSTGIKKIDVAKTGDTSGSEKPEVEETADNDGSKSNNSQQWSITPIISNPLIARINVGTDCLRVDSSTKSMIRGECPQIDSLDNSEYLFEISMKAVKNLTSLPKLMAKDQKSGSDDDKESIRKKLPQEGDERHRKTLSHSKQRKETVASEEKVESEEDSGIDVKEGNENENIISEDENSIGQDERFKLISDKGNQQAFIEVLKGEEGSPQRLPVQLKKFNLVGGESVQVPVVIDQPKSLKRTLPSKHSAHTKSAQSRGISHGSHPSPAKKRKTNSVSEDNLTLIGRDGNGRNIKIPVELSKIRVNGEPLDTSSDLQSKSNLQPKSTYSNRDTLSPNSEKPQGEPGNTEVPKGGTRKTDPKVEQLVVLLDELRKVVPKSIPSSTFKRNQFTSGASIQPKKNLSPSNKVNTNNKLMTNEKQNSSSLLTALREKVDELIEIAK